MVEFRRIQGYAEDMLHKSTASPDFNLVIFEKSGEINASHYQ
jgi:hypothetical protein